jgi:hypothetical protein
VPQRVGWLAVAFAACGWLFLWNLISTSNIFCGGGTEMCPSLAVILPRFIAMAGMGLSAVAIAVALYRVRIPAPWTGFGVVVTAGIALVLLLVTIVGEYDAILSSSSSGWLDRAYRPPVVPDAIRALGWVLWPVILGAWMTLASLQFLRLGVPVLIAGLGVVAGIAIVITVPYGQDYFVRTSIAPLELIVSLVWATASGVYLTTARRATAIA